MVQTPLTPADGHRGSVWILEDSPLEAEMARRALAADYDIELFTDGSTVIERMEHEQPDALIVDWHLPGLSGLETCEFLRQRFEAMALPILILTAQGAKQDVVEALNAGANDYLTKPYDVPELQARVRTLVRASTLNEMQAWRGRLLALDAELGDATTRSESLADLGQRAAAAMLQLLALDGVSIWLAKADVVDTLELLAESGQIDKSTSAEAAATMAEVERALTMQVLRERKPVTRDAFSASLHAEPLLVGGSAVGVIAVRRDGKLPPQIIEATHGVTDILALGIARARSDAERTELLARAEAARVEAERANRSKDEFLAMVSHELRTPLNAIAGWTKILLRTTEAGPNGEKARRGLETIERNVRAQTQLIDDLLDISRIISGQIRLNMQEVDIVQVIVLALDAVRFLAESKNVQIEVDLEPTAMPIGGDTDRLQQVVWNLLTNAVKFTPADGKVRVLAHREGPFAVLRIEDNGQGIPADFLPFVFDRFRQAEGSISRSKGGLGLGLAIVRHLVELHHGIVGATSEGENRGAQFTVRLPIAAARERALDAPARFASTPVVDVNYPKELIGLKIVVVEDDPDAREMLAELLLECRSIVYTASSAAEGMALLKERRPDVLLSDIAMPGEDGLSLIRRVRALPREQGGMVPAIALTAYARSEDRTAAMVAGFNTHVAKPVEPSELLLVIRNLAGRYS